MEAKKAAKNSRRFPFVPTTQAVRTAPPNRLAMPSLAYQALHALRSEQHDTYSSERKGCGS